MARFVLVDSSVWIDYFRGGSDTSKLEKLLTEDLICTNELILTELVPALEHQQQKQIISSLLALPRPKLTIDWEVLRHYQRLNIQNGVNKVGIPDLIILQQVIEENLALLSYDMHFRLMREYLDFELV